MSRGSAAPGTIERWLNVRVMESSEKGRERETENIFEGITIGSDPN